MHAQQQVLSTRCLPWPGPCLHTLNPSSITCAILAPPIIPHSTTPTHKPFLPTHNAPSLSPNTHFPKHQLSASPPHLCCGGDGQVFTRGHGSIAQVHRFKDQLVYLIRSKTERRRGEGRGDDTNQAAVGWHTMCWPIGPAPRQTVSSSPHLMTTHLTDKHSSLTSTTLTDKHNSLTRHFTDKAPHLTRMPTAAGLDTSISTPATSPHTHSTGPAATAWILAAAACQEGGEAERQ
jgi:hypothetical protein